MMFCRGCAKEIHESAQSCPSCGCVQNPTSVKTVHEGPIWLPITSMALGIVSILAMIDETDFDKDLIAGVSILSICGLTLGIISLNNQQNGKGMAIAGVVLSAIALLACLGL